MGEVVRNTYEISVLKGTVWDIPYARLEDATPTVSMPACVLSVGTGDLDQLSGTLVSVDAGDSVATIDFTAGSIYWHTVRNVLTYSGAAENTWGPIDIGDPVYYDRSATMPAGTYLSTSPLADDGVATSLFGHVVSEDDMDMALYPKGDATASTQSCGVMQRGAGS